jgi:hypothetical protein
MPISPEMKQRIDALSQYGLCERNRFAPVGDPMLQGEAGKYFMQRLREKGGMTPEISKSLGWERR